MDWLFLQLVDAGFPAGGFAHSMGLEAALAMRRGLEAERHVDELLLSAARTALPFVRRACEAPLTLPDLDLAYDAATTSHVVNRSSRAQGRALASAARRIWDTHEGVLRIGEHAAHEPAHHAPVFGALFGVLGQAPRAAETGYLHGVLRGALSAAVRLGALGPLEAQRLHGARAEACERALATAADLGIDAVAQPAPLLELYATLHDRLEARLFQS